MIRSKLYDFFSGDCSDEEILLIKEWAESSEENMKNLQKERALYDMLLLHKEKLSEENTNTVEETPVRRTNRKLLWNFAKVACVILIALFSGYIAKYTVYEDLNSSIQTIDVPAGQYISMELPDGSKVWINAQTTIKYPPVFNHKKRYVYLDGEAYFQVKKNKDLPFEVETPKGSIKVLGTEFNVKSYSTDEDFTTSLISGSIEISLKGSDQTILMNPNTSASLHGGRLKIDPIVSYSPYTWKDGLLTFSDVSFAEMMEKFEKIYGVDIVIENSEVIKHRYTGKFRIVEGVDYALNILQKSIRFKSVKDAESNTIYIR